MKRLMRILLSLLMIAALSSCEKIEIVEAQFEAVDLGLSVKWASFNLGASAPEDFGNYYAWGATEPWYKGGSTSPSLKKCRYNWANCPFNDGDKYFNDSYWNAHKSEFLDANNVLLPENDAAHVRLGGGWRMPTKEELEELANINKCSWTWTQLNGVNGYKVQSKIPGYTDKWIFLPAAGLRDDSELLGVGNVLRYWSSSLYTDDPRDAWLLGYYPSLSSTLWWRYSGLSVRPVVE